MSYIYNLTDTWNAVGTSFNGIKMAITNTASASSSYMLNLSVSGATTGSFTVDKSGNANVSGALTLGTALSVANGGTGLTALTVNRVPYVSATDTLGTSANFLFDGSNLSLGTTAANFAINIFKSSYPYAQFIDGATGTTATDGFRVGYESGTGAYIQNFENTLMAFFTNNTARMTISAAGKISVNTTTADIGQMAIYHTSVAASSANFLDPTKAALNLWGDSTLRVLIGTDASAPYGGYIQASNTTTGNWPLYLNPYGSAATAQVLIGTTTLGACRLVVNDSSIQINSAKTPASAAATGTTGQVCWDASYIYVCTATNTWKRAAIATW